CSQLFYLHYIFFFFFNDTSTTEIYTLSLHDALPISLKVFGLDAGALRDSRKHARADLFTIVECEDNIGPAFSGERTVGVRLPLRSEEHTSELQSRSDLVCRLLLEKKKKKLKKKTIHK